MEINPQHQGYNEGLICKTVGAGSGERVYKQTRLSIEQRPQLPITKEPQEIPSTIEPAPELTAGAPAETTAEPTTEPTAEATAEATAEGSAQIGTKYCIYIYTYIFI